MYRFEVTVACQTCDIRINGAVEGDDEGQAHTVLFALTRGWAAGHQKHDQIVFVRGSD